MPVLNPYLSFRDDAREAMEFYGSVLGGDLTMTTFGEYGVSEDHTERDKIMRARLESADGLVLMGADTPNAVELVTGTSISLALSGGHEDEPELRSHWEKLTARGTVTLPLGRPPWGGLFGMCTDKFGVRWMVSIAASEQT